MSASKSKKNFVIITRITRVGILLRIMENVIAVIETSIRITMEEKDIQVKVTSLVAVIVTDHIAIKSNYQ